MQKFKTLWHYSHELSGAITMSYSWIEKEALRMTKDYVLNKNTLTLNYA